MAPPSRSMPYVPILCPVNYARMYSVQNSPNCVAKLRRNSLSVLADHVRVNRVRNWRAVGVSESLLTQFLRCSETVHQRVAFA